MKKAKRTISGIGTRTVRGFSLGEVILSVAVLTIGLLPILGSISGAFSTSVNSRDLIIATGLAQEGAELVMNVKDNSVIANPAAPFAAFPKNGGGNPISSDTCRISLADTTVLSAPSSANRISCSVSGANYYDLTIDAGFYKHMASVGKFKRRIYLIESGLSYRVGSAVYWGAHVPGNANNPTQLDAARAGCTSANKCVFVDMELSSWK